jgi:diguanylate cyclase (GGDEF)-like protein
MNIVNNLEKRSKLFWAITGIVLLFGVGAVDFLTGYEISFSLFYLFPIILVAWFAGRPLGVATSIASAVIWLVVDITSGHIYSRPLIHYWNGTIRFGFFIVVTLLMSALKNALEHQKELSHIDNLTGAINSRFFSELVQKEIDRFQRHSRPFTVVYIDFDNFKAVNDDFGHSIGDKVLCTAVKYAKLLLRKIDVIARLGGDEFALLLPETDQAGAKVAISKIQIGLLDEMHKNNWPVTFSIGVLTCVNMPQTTDELIKRADELMYLVKKNGKNSINYSVYTG